MLIAQARVENLALLTREAKIVGYGQAGAHIAVLVEPDPVQH